MTGMLKCMKCGAVQTHADAQIGNIKKDCGVDRATTKPNERGSMGGEKHNWVPTEE